jgi:dipeptidyl aminopeptidase/acylaminoacyl peptidase
MKRIPAWLCVCLLWTVAAVAQPDTFAPNENLVVDGVPAVPMAVVQDAQRYSNFRAAELASWNPGRREMLIATRFADSYQIHLVKMPGGARTQLTFAPEPSVGAQFNPRDGKSFIFRRDVGGGEFYQFYRYDLDSAAITLLTDGKSRNIGAIWDHAGKRIVYGSTRRTGNDVDFWAMDPSDPKSDHIVAQNKGGGWEALDWSWDGRHILAQEEISANESYLWLVDAASGEKTAITARDNPTQISYQGGRFSKDGKGIYVTTDKDSEFHRLAYIDLASKQHTYLTSNIPWDVDEFDLSEDGAKLAFVSNEDGYGVLHVLNSSTRKEVVLPKLPRGVITNPQWHKNNHELGFDFNSASVNDDVYSLDLQSGRLERWTESETGGVNISSVRQPDLIHWKSWDDRPISGFLFRPPAKFTGKRPVMINIHGGPEGQFRPYFLGRSLYYVNELGIAMIYPNVRGSSGYGKSFLALDNGLLREGSYKDINSLLDWVATQPDLDASRVMITGGSYGGFMTLAVATNYDDRICCSVDVVGISNLVSFLQNTSGYRQDLRRVEYGDERDPKMREFLAAISPLTKARNITKPLFVIQGKNDPRVPMTESEQMVKTVRGNGGSVWYLLARDEGHGYQKKKNQDFQCYATVMFVKEFLLK